MREQWDELKETIIELRDNDGTATQQEVCQFLANLMNVLEAQIEPERKKGVWEMEWNSFFGINVPRCSVCHKLAAVRTPICPNCFAQMDTFDLKEET